MIVHLLLAAMLAASGPPCGDAAPALSKALAALDDGRLADADAVLGGLHPKLPACAAFLVASGRLELGKHNYDQADHLSVQALAAFPGDAGALALRGQMLIMQGRAADGMPMLERAVMLDPRNAEACFQLGAIHDRAKRNAPAVAMFEKAVRLRPGDPRGWDYLGLNLEPLGRIVEAGQAYQKGLAVNAGPRFDSFLDYNYGRLLLKLNRLEESKSHLDRAVELVPQLRATHYDHAKLNVRLGNFKDARVDAERALSIADPNGLILDLQVYNLLVLIYSRLGEDNLARHYAGLSEATHIPLRTEERK